MVDTNQHRSGAIVAEQLGRSFRVPVKAEGVGGTLRYFFQRTYKDVHAVSDVGFTIEPGERVGFLGGNGAGKTTTLKMLSGLLLPTSGRVVVDGHTPFDKAPAFLKQIALVMGNKQQLIWDLPARDSLRLQAAIYEIDDVTAKRRIAELAALLDIEKLLDQPVRKLSLGERMKAELLHALLHEPKVLFLDEPTLGLDVNAQVAVREFLARYNERTGATILLTSHYMADITALCSRVIVIHEGRLHFDGDLKALTARFAPEKQIQLELDRVVVAADVDTAMAAVGAHGGVDGFRHVESEGRIVRFAVTPKALTRVVPVLLQALSPIDFAVQEPPIDEVIGRVIRGERGDESATTTTTTTAASS
ncbi:MAG TPA: ATP-binding cassette domain-containing protein [Myxococcota bacterium]